MVSWKIVLFLQNFENALLEILFCSYGISFSWKILCCNKIFFSYLLENLKNVFLLHPSVLENLMCSRNLFKKSLLEKRTDILAKLLAGCFWRPNNTENATLPEVLKVSTEQSLTFRIETRFVIQEICLVIRTKDLDTSITIIIVCVADVGNGADHIENCVFFCIQNEMNEELITKETFSSTICDKPAGVILIFFSHVNYCG